MATCPRCEGRLELVMDGYKLLDAYCENEDCELAEGAAGATWLTDREYTRLCEDWAGDQVDAAYERFKDRGTL